jgi:1,4-alpha-glucan branching enzyme
MHDHGVPEPGIKRKRIYFMLDAPGAKEVKLAIHSGRCNFRCFAMKKKSDGIWERHVLLVPGIYGYNFLVDGMVRKDPKNRRTIFNGNGEVQNELLVYHPNTREI